ncbi:hypothetical protein LBMAG51_10750 [Phycisphaerae bacterium]|nr:hypothetical protein LBMAG51_10750 [Phycisphaerae bacterium]
MSENKQSTSLGKKLGLTVAILLAIVVVFVAVMCTAGQAKVLESPADFPAPNN